MTTDRRKPERKSDKIQRYSDRAYKIGWSIGIAFLLYIIIPMRAEIKDLRKETLEIYKNCTEEINDVRKDTTEKISKMKDQIIAMFKNRK